ncbi:MAG: hypothetical protein IPG45_38240 [Deltaproteobacteria bacterium]|jgi:hypothetical protein|nr:hypothetical protein [Deltaproteobacteria bacterium]
MGELRSGLAVALVFFVSGCAKELDVCAASLSPWEVVFLGEAYGRGEVALERQADGHFRGHLRLAQAEGQAADAGLRLEGRGVCRDGVVRIDFGGGSTPDGSLQVLGGTLTAVLARPGIVDQPFGVWTAELRSAAWKAQRRVGGPWILAAPKAEARDDLAEAPRADLGSPGSTP